MFAAGVSGSKVLKPSVVCCCMNTAQPITRDTAESRTTPEMDELSPFMIMRWGGGKKQQAPRCSGDLECPVGLKHFYVYVASPWHSDGQGLPEV